MLMKDANLEELIVPLSLDEIRQGHPMLREIPIEPEVVKMEFITLLFVLMAFFFVMAACNDKFKPRCGHQTSFTIILGISAALILWYSFGDARVE